MRLFLRLSRWNDLKDVYARQAELATDPARKKERLFVLGQVYDRELQDAPRAIETYTSILDMDPDDLDALQALDRLYLQTERWYDLLNVLERQTELSSSSAEVVLVATASVSCGRTSSKMQAGPRKPISACWPWIPRTSRP